MNQITIFDTTLRDGDQASGHTMHFQDKIKLAPLLKELGVNIIEAGFPISSPGDFQAVHQIAKEVGNDESVTICGLARTATKDIEEAARALEPAKRSRIHTFISTSPLHMEFKLRKTPEQVMDIAMQSVEKARQYTSDIEFSLEDFGRTAREFAVKMVVEAIKAGATTINLPDTVGFFEPFEAYEKIKYVIDTVQARGYTAIFSVHNHDDLGMATANTLAGIRAGCTQAEVTINGIGERAGNAALEEVVAALHAKKLGSTTVHTKLIGSVSKAVAEVTGHEPQWNKAIVGRNAFAHEAGIHQHGQSKHERAYEFLDPEDFGVKSIITLGPRSGRNALRGKYGTLGINLSDDQFQDAAFYFVQIADQTITIDDADLIRALHSGKEIPVFYQFDSYSPSGEGFAVAVNMRIGGQHFVLSGQGNGFIDAAVHGIKKRIANSITMNDFRVTAEGPGSNAVAYSQVKLMKNGWEVKGIGEHTDVVTSSIIAYLDGCNRLRYIEEFMKGYKS